MGGSQSTLSRELDGVEADERFFGLDNFGNTCYANSVIQALFTCKRFRTALLQYVKNVTETEREDTVMMALADLFHTILSQPQKSGCIQPTRFIQTLRRLDRRFRNFQPQDAQEFLNFVLDSLIESIQAAETRLEDASPPAAAADAGSNGGSSSSSAPSGPGSSAPSVAAGTSTAPPLGSDVPVGSSAGPDAAVRSASGSAPSTTPRSAGPSGAPMAAALPVRPSSQPLSVSQRSSQAAKRTFVHDIFCGKTVTHTRCMLCESQSEREEEFKELKLEVEQPDTSLEQCMLAFSRKELLDADNKFHCSGCNSYQEAQKWVDIKHCPPVFIIHLNRLSFMHSLGREQKVKHRVTFGQTLTPPNLSKSCDNGGLVVYTLFAVIVHVGSTASNGHYISYVKSSGKWFCFDDGRVQVATLAEVEATFGKASDWSFGNDLHAYVLCYELSDQETDVRPGSTHARHGRSGSLGI